MPKLFDKEELKELYIPSRPSSGEDNGQVTIIGGSKLFHGAPLLSLKVASRIVDMVYFASPEPSVGRIAEQIKSKLFSFMWVPWDEVEEYIKKSDSVLIGPGFMRFGSEKTPEQMRNYNHHEAGRKSRKLTEGFLKSFPNKRWVIDAGSLQVIDPELLPKGCVITPNRKEFRLLFKVKQDKKNITQMAKKYNCIINSKGPTNLVCSPDECVEIKGGNAGLTKGGTGDVLAGLAVALLAKNEPFLAAASASFIAKAAADELHKKVGTNFNAEDLADNIPGILQKLSM
ncbi:MAG: NAD(P)H-hydrate dehydratase [Patescibacteria group bacterium]